MKAGAMVGGAVALGALVLALGVGRMVLRRVSEPMVETPRASGPAGAGDFHPSFIYGRITTVDGATYEGRLRWGGNQEAFWGNFFNGAKRENTWAAHVPAEQLPKERRPFSIFGLKLADRERPADLGRLYMTRFGDLARVEADARDVRVTLKSGAVTVLKRSEASDFDDGVRVWDRVRGVADLDSLRIRAIDFLPAPSSAADPGRLYGTVRTRRGRFAGFIQWNREECLRTDELPGRVDGRLVRLRFDTIASMRRRSRDFALLQMTDGRELEFTGTGDSGLGPRGIYVDDARYGRVLVGWDAFEGVEFAPGPSGPTYDDYPAGGPLAGSVTTRDGRRVAGRLVFDLDESEITDTLDAPAEGVDYILPFGLVASIVLPEAEEADARRARVTLHRGEELALELTGDLGERNAGLLVFGSGAARPAYVAWTQVARIDLERPRAMYPGAGR